MNNDLRDEFATQKENLLELLITSTRLRIEMGGAFERAAVMIRSGSAEDSLIDRIGQLKASFKGQM